MSSGQWRPFCLGFNILNELKCCYWLDIAMIVLIFPDSKVHGANMGPTWVLSAPDGPDIGPMNLAVSDM